MTYFFYMYDILSWISHLIKFNKILGLAILINLCYSNGEVERKI